MEARATLRGPKVSRTLVACVLVVVALGVGAMGGYVAANLGGGKVASPKHIAPLAQTVPDQSKAVLPDWLVQEITPKTTPTPRIRQDDPNFITLPVATSQSCPAGTHVAVWYTVRAWGCVSNSAGHSAKIDE
jgi:hypothetical protein